MVVRRNLEFGQPLDSQIAIWPAGNSFSSFIVTEPRGGRLVVHDNPTRVPTKAPTFDWHLTNLNNSVTLMQPYPAPN